jgi:carboxyl-terminal processing protease
MNKKSFLTAIIAGVILVSGTTLGLSQLDKTIIKDLYAQMELFSYALTLIQSEYVEEKTPQDLIYGSLKGMLSSLDTHSQFMDPEEYTELKSETSGKFGGLGIEISIRDGLLTVITPIEGTPAWEAGVMAGDKIVKIGNELTKNMTLSDAVKKLRGEPGTEVTITVLRDEEFKILEFSIVRKIIEVQDVKYPQILDDHIAYIRLTEFRENSGKSFEKALKKLRHDGADSLIIDLRNNPGGLLSVAIQITEMFLPKDTPIVSTKGRRASQNMDTVSQGSNNEKFLDWPIAVLINEGSASGSEILAGALKDNNRAIIVGKQSFGKGSVQSVLPLPDGSGLKLTTSKYFTPSGISIHGTGIIPDIIVKRVDFKPDESEDQERQLEQLFDKVRDEINTTDDNEKNLTQDERNVRHRLLNDNQVQAAINVLKGVKIYQRIDPKAGQKSPVAIDS